MYVLVVILIPYTGYILSAHLFLFFITALYLPHFDWWKYPVYSCQYSWLRIMPLSFVPHYLTGNSIHVRWLISDYRWYLTYCLPWSDVMWCDVHSFSSVCPCYVLWGICSVSCIDTVPPSISTLSFLDQTHQQAWSTNTIIIDQKQLINGYG